MRVAIVLGVSSYDNLSDLPACGADAAAIGEFFKRSGRFDDVRLFSGRLEANQTKDHLSRFIESLQKESVEEVAFYFSGHGSAGSENTYFHLSDYREGLLRQTSISNSEVDAWFRSLSPNVAVKVLDCCQAAVHYVKDSPSTREILEASKVGLNHCYFLFSSRGDQESFAADDLSYFTRAVLEGLGNRKDGPVRYKDLIDAAIDAFPSHIRQEPQYVLQGPLTDVLCEMTPELRGWIQSLLTNVSMQSPEEAPRTADLTGHLEELVRRDAEACLSMEDAQAAATAVEAVFESFDLAESQLERFYEAATVFRESTWEAVPNASMVGRWLLRIPEKPFAEAVVVKRRQKKDESYQSVVFGVPLYETVEEVTGFTSTAEIVRDFGEIHLKSKYPNLPDFKAGALFIFGLRRMYLLSFVCALEARSWGTRIYPDDVRWTVSRLRERFPEQAATRAREVLDELLSSVERHLHEQFLPESELKPGTK